MKRRPLLLPSATQHVVFIRFLAVLFMCARSVVIVNLKWSETADACACVSLETSNRISFRLIIHFCPFLSRHQLKLPAANDSPVFKLFHKIRWRKNRCEERHAPNNSVIVELTVTQNCLPKQVFSRRRFVTCHWLCHFPIIPVRIFFHFWFAEFETRIANSCKAPINMRNVLNFRGNKINAKFVQFQHGNAIWPRLIWKSNSIFVDFLSLLHVLI